MTREQLQARHPHIKAEDYIQHPNGGGWKHRLARVSDTVALPVSIRAQHLDAERLVEIESALRHGSEGR